MVTVEAMVRVPRVSTNWVVLFQPSVELIELKGDQAGQREAFGRLLVAPRGIQCAAVPARTW